MEEHRVVAQTHIQTVSTYTATLKISIKLHVLVGEVGIAAKCGNDKISRTINLISTYSEVHHK
jgi:hypothetical protein